MTDRYVYLKIVHPPTGEAPAPLKRAGRSIVLQVMDGDEVLGFLGGVSDVSERFALDGAMTLELTLAAFHESIEKVQWPQP
jgi:hypothetical protein